MKNHTIVDTSIHQPVWQVMDVTLGGVGNRDIVLHSNSTPPCDRERAEQLAWERMRSLYEAKSHADAVIIANEQGEEVARATTFDVM